MTEDPTYHCGHCGTTWSYRAVRYVACCRDCGGGLVRTDPLLTLAPAAAAPAPPPLRQAAA
jgi:hypothetical protein